MSWGVQMPIYNFGHILTCISPDGNWKINAAFCLNYLSPGTDYSTTSSPLGGSVYWAFPMGKLG